MTQPIILDVKDDYTIWPIEWMLIFGLGVVLNNELYVADVKLTGPFCWWPKRKRN